MACRCVVLQELEEGEGVKSRERISSSSASSCCYYGVSGSVNAKSRVEKVFPVLEMKMDGNPKSMGLRSECLDDPIWDIIRAEAKSEVVTFLPGVFFYISVEKVWILFLVNRCGSQAFF